jgi:rhamnogalacturonyl hydrolase YesR
MSPRSPLELAAILAAEYGDVLEPVNYIRGVSMSGRLRLQQLSPDRQDPAPAMVELVEPLLEPGSLAEIAQADGSVHAGFVWADELSDATGDRRYIDAQRYIDVLTSLLEGWSAQPDSGLWWHCKASPFYWGRGNAFAALGFAEALTYLPEAHCSRPALLTKHRAHLEALVRHQDPFGAWHQLIDRPDSYRELTATAMIGYVLARGLKRGWLGDEFHDPLTNAWSAVDERVDDSGMVRDACAGTGPMPALDDYLRRPTADGHDDRAGSMALWFAVECAQVEG